MRQDMTADRPACRTCGTGRREAGGEGLNSSRRPSTRPATPHGPRSTSAHARTGDRIAIAAHLGGSDKFDRAVADFGETYADQNERDHAALANAVASGRVQAQTGI